MAQVSSLDKQFCQQVLGEPFPTGSLKRVDRPTTAINAEDVQRIDPRNHGFRRAARGEYGSLVERESNHFVSKHPLSGALLGMTKFLAAQGDGSVADRRVPWSDGPRAMSWHIKETAYFLRADMVGIGRLPPYATYTHSRDGEPIELDHKYAVAMLVDQDYRTSSASTEHDWISSAMAFRSYSTSGFIACMLAEYIRRPGYPARAHFSMNYQVVVPLTYSAVGWIGGDVSHRRHRGEPIPGAQVQSFGGDHPPSYGSGQAYRLRPAGFL